MLRNYLKTAWRNLWKNKVYSAINIFGFSIGMAGCLVILLFVFYEKSFDQFHRKNLYRLNEVQKFPGMVASQKVALSMFPMGPTLQHDFPEIRHFTRVNWSNKLELSFRDKRVYLPQVFFVDSNFLQMFDFRIIQGDRIQALQKPNSLILTRSSAKKIFGTEDAIGKTLVHYGDDTISVVVTGIMEDAPENSQLQFDGLLSFSTIYNQNPKLINNWSGNWLDTYLELAPGTDPKVLEKKFPGYLKKYMAGDNQSEMYELFLLPLQAVHAGASDIGLDYLNYQKFSKQDTKLFAIIALIVLVIACVNFMNLSTARSAERAKEVGVRKSIGADRWQLAFQFIGETVLLSFFALLLSFLWVALALPGINSLSQRHLDLVVRSHPSYLLLIILGTLVIGVLSGLYPAAYLSSFRPVKVLKGTMQGVRGKSLLRSFLVVAQFSSAIFLMVATIFVLLQLQFMLRRDPGFNRDQVVSINLDENTYKKYYLFKHQLQASSLVSGVTASQDLLGSHLDQSGIRFKGDGPLRHLVSTRLIVDPDYLKLYQIRLVEGRNFYNEPTANGKEYIINESLAQELLKDYPKANLHWLLGRNFGFDSTGTIVGIAKNFNFNSLHYPVETMFLVNQKDWGYNVVSAKINGGKTREALAFIQATWKSIFPEYPLELQFLDDHFKEIYRTDRQVCYIVGILAALAILISCLGLFGLASYSAEQRIKEIGIRRVMGASVRQIVGLLSAHFLQLVFWAILIACPLAILGIVRWFRDYAYHVPISWWVFASSGLAAILIAMLTISTQAIRAAVSNPVKNLRTE